MCICKLFCLILVHSNTFQAFVMYNLMYQLQCSSIKFCSYNFVLNEVPNKNDVTHVANIVLNKAPNSNDAIHVTNNVRLTTMGAQQFSMAADIQPSCRIANLPETRDNDTITSRKGFCRWKINFALGKNGGYMPRSLGSRSISVGRQAGSE